MQLYECVGYVNGSIHGGYDHEYFDFKLNELCGVGAVPIWNTHKIFIVGDDVFASIILDIQKVSNDDFNGCHTIILPLKG